MMIKMKQTCRMVLGAMALVASVAAQAAPVGLGIAVNGQCLAGACDVTGLASNNHAASLAVDHMVTMPNQDRYQAKVWSGPGTVGTSELPSWNVVLHYRGQDDGTFWGASPLSQANHLEVSLYHAFEASGDLSMSTPIVSYVGFIGSQSGILASAGISFTDLATGLEVAGIDPLSPSREVTSNVAWTLTSVNGVAMNKMTIILDVQPGAYTNTLLQVASIPEPATMASMMLGLVGVMVAARRKMPKA